MSRTRLESVGLCWHVAQMLIVTYMLFAPKRLTADFDSGVWTLLYIPFAAGWWLAGLLRTPTVAVLFLAALFWAAMAIEIQGSVFILGFPHGCGLPSDDLASAQGFS